MKHLRTFFAAIALFGPTGGIGVLMAVLTSGCSQAPKPPQNAVPFDVVGKMPLEKIEMGERVFASPLALRVDTYRKAWLEKNVTVRLARETSKEAYLEIFRGEDGYYVILHGDHRWTMADGPGASMFHPVNTLWAAKTMDPIVTVDGTDLREQARSRLKRESHNDARARVYHDDLQHD